MVDTSFQDRLARLESKSGFMVSEPAAPPRDPAPDRPETPPMRFATEALIGLVFLPLGSIAGVLTRLYLDPALSWTVSNKIWLMGVVGGFHLGVIAALVAIMVTRFGNLALNKMTLFSIVGYGLMWLTLELALR